jgi:hypothetical protein
MNSGLSQEEFANRGVYHGDLARAAFNDIAMLIASLPAFSQISDDAQWTLMKGLDRIRIRLQRDFAGRTTNPSDLDPGMTQPPPKTPHVAVAEFLYRNNERRGE